MVTGWGVFELVKSTNSWKLYLVAPSKKVADEVAVALRKFVRERYEVFGPGYRVNGVRIVGERNNGTRVTWGEAADEWTARYVRDGLAQSLVWAKQDGRAITIKPYTIAYIKPGGLQQPTEVSMLYDF